MKFFNIFSRFLVTIILMVGLFVMYDIYILSHWLNNRLLDKFVINVLLKDSTNVEEIIRNINLNRGSINFREITYIDKQQLFNEIKQKEEFNMILSILKENPFYDIIRIKFNNFSTMQVTSLLNYLRNNVYVKQVIYDYNLKTYLQRLERFMKIYEIVCVVLLAFIMLIIIFNLFSLDKNSKLLNLPAISFVIFFMIFVVFNKEIINKMTSSTLIDKDSLTFAIFGLIYLFGILQNVIPIEENKEDNNE